MRKPRPSSDGCLPRSARAASQSPSLKWSASACSVSTEYLFNAEIVCMQEVLPMPLPRSNDWLGVPAGHPFGLQTLPFGSFSSAHHPARRRVGVAIGDHVLVLTSA